MIPASLESRSNLILTSLKFGRSERSSSQAYKKLKWKLLTLEIAVQNFASLTTNCGIDVGESNPLINNYVKNYFFAHCVLMMKLWFR